MAQENNNVTNDTRRHDIAIQLFEAYSALSCCFVNHQMISDALLPGLRCLKQDVIQVAPEHAEVVQSMIRDYENKLESAKPVKVVEEPSPTLARAGPHISTSSPGLQIEDVKSRVMSRWKDSNISGIFTRKK